MGVVFNLFSRCAFEMTTITNMWIRHVDGFTEMF